MVKFGILLSTELDYFDKKNIFGNFWGKKGVKLVQNGIFQLFKALERNYWYNELLYDNF